MSELMASIDAIPDSVTFGITILLVLALCALSNWRNPAEPKAPRERALGDGVPDLEPASPRALRVPLVPASPGPDGEEPSGVRQGANPPKGAVVSGSPSHQLEQAPACDRASDLLSDINPTASDKPRRVDVRSTAAGAPAVIYSWRRPGEAKRLIEVGWELEKIDDEYGGWLVRKEERWP